MVSTESDLIKAHKHAINHREEILQSKICECFDCVKTFSPNLVKHWTDKQWHPKGATALCPCCGNNSVIGDKSAFRLSEHFLEKMRAYWCPDEE